MYFVVLAVHPAPSHARYGEIDGAYAACWADAMSAREAELVAREALAASGWETDEVEEPPRMVVREEFVGDAVAAQRFDEARESGVAVTLHTWPVGAPDQPE